MLSATPLFPWFTGFNYLSMNCFIIVFLNDWMEDSLCVTIFLQSHEWRHCNVRFRCLHFIPLLGLRIIVRLCNKYGLHATERSYHWHYYYSLSMDEVTSCEIITQSTVNCEFNRTENCEFLFDLQIAIFIDHVILFDPITESYR